MLWWEVVTLAIIVLLGIWFLMTCLAMAIGGSFSAPFVPSGKRTVDKMLKAAKLKPNDVVWDLGSGDGRLLLAAANIGVKKLYGVEIALPLIFWSRINCYLRKPKHSQITIYFGDLFSAQRIKEIQQADVVLVFLICNESYF